MLHTARSGDGIAYLDLDSDRYCCEYRREAIEDYFNLSARSLAGSWSDGLPLPDHPWSCLPPVGQRPRLVDIVRFGSALIESWVIFRGASVQRLLRHVGARDLPDADPQTATRIASIYRLLLRTMPFKSQCLFRSFLLMNFLRRYGVTADWVFGVHLFPFRAHCWVAVEHKLLNERPHRIKDYQTIYTLKNREQWPTI